MKTKLFKKVFAILLVFSMFFVVSCGKKASLSFEDSEYNATVGDTFTLKVVLENSESKVAFKSSDENVVKYANDTFTAVGEGSAVVTGYLVDNEKVSATIKINVSAPALSGEISLSPAKTSGYIGETVVVNVVTTFDFNDLEFALSNDNASLEKGNGSLNITLAKEGEVTVTATLKNHPEFSANTKLTINVADPTIELKLDKTSYVVGETGKLAPTVVYAKTYELEFSSSDNNVVAIDEEGNFTALAFGSARLTAVVKGTAVSATVKVDVVQLITEFEVAYEDSMVVYGSQDLTITTTPAENVSNKFEITSSNELIISVNFDGGLDALAPGTVTITVKTTDGSNLTKTFEVTVLDGSGNGGATYADANLASYSPGQTVTYEGYDYVVGLSAFATLDEAVAAATTKTYVAPGTYHGLDILKEDFELIGPNAGINPMKETRVDAAIIDGVITIQTGSKNVTITGFDFTGDGMIDCKNAVDGVTVTFNNVYETNDDAAASKWIEGRYEAEAVFDFWASSNDLAEISRNIVIKYNKFSGVNESNIVLARLYNVTVTNNGFYNFGLDAIRGEGGYNYGAWVFENNEFINDEYSGKNAIYLQATSGLYSDEKWQTVDILSNTFKNVGDASDTKSLYMGAICARTYQEKGLTGNILYNTFENCANYINYRNNGATADTFEMNINYNKFVGVPSGVYHRNLDPRLSGDTATSNPQLANMDYNLFIDNEGAVITDLAAYADKFFDLASCNNNYQTLKDYEEAIKSLTGIDYTAVVSAGWAELVDGNEVTVDGLTWTIGTDAFVSIVDALSKLPEGSVIKVLAGEYADELTINKNNITLMGPNKGMNGQFVNREAEAVLSNAITVKQGVTGFVLDGFELTGACNVNMEASVTDLTVQYNVLNATNKDGLIRSPGDAGAYVYNIKFIGNYSTNYSGNRVAHLTYVDGLIMNDNYIECSSSYDFLNCQGIICGECEFKNNTYINSNQSFLYALGVKDINVLIQGNYIENIANTIIDFRAMNQDDGKATFNILNNTFVESGKAWRPIRIRPLNYKDTNELTVNVNYNKFIESFANYVPTTSSDNNTTILFVENPVYDAALAKFKAYYNMDYNFYKVNGEVMTEFVTQNFDYAALSWENAYAKEEDMPAYVADDSTAPTSIQITNKITALGASQTHQIEFKIAPDSATNKKVAYKTSDASIATVSGSGMITAKKEGEVTITVYSAADNTVSDSMTIKVSPVERIELRYEGNAVLKKGDTLQINSTYHGDNYEDPTITYASSNDSVATVDEAGTVTAKGAGLVEITATLGTLEAKVGFTVIEEDLTGLLAVLAKGNNGVILNQDIMYIGSDDGTADYLHNIFGSANDYYAGTLPETTLNMLSHTAPNFDGGTMDKVEFIVVHDTGSAGSSSTAYANSHWCTNPSNNVTSWHYTIGNDGIFKQLEDTDYGWHAGDGLTSYDFEWFDTGIAYEGDRPTVTVGSDRYFYVNGKKSNVTIPAAATTNTPINRLGLVCVKGENGNYMIPTTYVNGTYNAISAFGGGCAGIGIETAVNMGSDVYLTWQYTAKFSVGLLLKHNLGVDRLWFHNSFANKKCPNTMITADLVDTFLELVYCEYEIAKNYSDYKIEFTSSNPELLDNSGRVVKAPDYTTNVTYKVTITDSQGAKQEITLNTLIIGKYNL